MARSRWGDMFGERRITVHRVRMSPFRRAVNALSTAPNRFNGLRALRTQALDRIQRATARLALARFRVRSNNRRMRTEMWRDAFGMRDSRISTPESREALRAAVVDGNRAVQQAMAAVDRAQEDLDYVNGEIRDQNQDFDRLVDVNDDPPRDDRGDWLID